MTKTITRAYSDYASAQLAVRELKAAGLGDSHIGIVASNADGWHKPGGGNVDPKHDKDRDGKDDRAEGPIRSILPNSNTALTNIAARMTAPKAPSRAEVSAPSPVVRLASRRAWA